MAVTAVPTTMAGAINYTIVTDTSADFPAVANSTYFYNKADELVRYKDSTGTILEIFSASGGASGIFGISNSVGVYTYYTTLTLAMAAAVSGQVIEMFADVVETGAVTVTLKTGVNINGNGHTYTLNTSTTTTGFIDGGVAVIMLFSNITLIRKGTGAGIMIGLSVDGNRIIGESTFIKVESNSSFGINVYNSAVFSGYIKGFNVLCTGTNCTGIRLIRGYIDGCSAIGTGTTQGIALTIGEIVNSYGECTGSGTGIVHDNTGIMSNCVGKSNTGYGIQCSVTANNCTGYSSGNLGIYGNILNNCTGISSGNHGIWASLLNNCSGYSTAGLGIFAQNGNLNTCTAYSTVNSALNLFNSTTAHNCTLITISGASVVATGTASTYASLKNCTIINLWNNASGHGVDGNAVLVVTGCSIKVSNASAKAIYSASTLTMKYANNNFEGSTAPISTTITQGIINTSDNQGNILV